MDLLIKKSLKINFFIVLIIILVLVFNKKFFWAGGIIIGNMWSVINFLLLVHILKIAILAKDKTSLSMILLLKFPVLYLIGFLILNSRIFPVLSLVSAGGLVLVSMGAAKLCLVKR